MSNNKIVTDNKEGKNGFGGGIFKGDRHSAPSGGIGVEVAGGGKVLTETDEALLIPKAVDNKKTYSFNGKTLTNREIASSINQNYGGVPIKKKGGSVQKNDIEITDEDVIVPPNSVVITRGALLDTETKHNFNGEMLTNQEILSRLNEDAGGESFDDVKIKAKGGKLSKTPAPKKERIFGSKTNKKNSAENIDSAKEIKFDTQTNAKILNIILKHNKEYPNKKINIDVAKAVVRRGMGAYSTSHRPTIKDNKPNSRVAWGLARLNAFVYKIQNGKSKSEKYSQDDDLISELGYKVKPYESGGTLDNRKEFIKWFNNWYKDGVNELMNITISLPVLEQEFNVKSNSNDVVILDLFEKIKQDINAKIYLKEICQKADEYGITILAEPIPRYKYFLRNIEKRKKINVDYLKKYYSNFGFESVLVTKYLVRYPKEIFYEKGGYLDFGCNHKMQNGVLIDALELSKENLNTNGIVIKSYDKNIVVIAYNTGGQERDFKLYNLNLISDEIATKIDYYKAAEIVSIFNDRIFLEKFDEKKIDEYKQAKHLIISNQNEVIYNSNDNFEKGGEIAYHEETYKKWKSLVNMSKSELENFYNSTEGKEAGLSSSEAAELGIHSGRESARWIMKMKDTPKDEWTPTMWDWAKRQISFISRMKGNKGGLYDDKGNKTRKHTSLLIWGHNPEKFEGGGFLEINNDNYIVFAEEIKKWCEKNGLEINRLSESITDYGESHYYQVTQNGEYPLKIRISDHSVENLDRIRNEIHFRVNGNIWDKDFINGIEKIEYYYFSDRYEKVPIKEIQQIYVFKDKIRPTDKLLGKEFITKKGETTYFIEREKVTNFFKIERKQPLVYESGGTLNNKQMEEFEMLKKQAMQELYKPTIEDIEEEKELAELGMDIYAEKLCLDIANAGNENPHKLSEEFLKGFETEKSEHNTTLEKLEEHNISKDEAISEIAESHLEENPNYYDKEDCGCEHDEFGRGGSMINKRMKYRKNYTEQWGKYGYGSVEKEDIDLNKPDWAKSENVLSYMQVKKGDYVGVKTKDGYTKGYVKDKPDYSYIVLDNGLEYDYQNSVLYTNLPKEEKQDNKSDFNENLKDEYKENRQLLDEFFTPKYIAEIMYKLALKHGFKGSGKVLEPSFGGGVFIDVLLKNGIKESNIWGFEIFMQSFNMAKLNYPKANLINHNFEYEFAKETKALNRDGIFQNEEFKNIEFDLVIGNPPYGSHKSPYSYLFDKDLQIRIEGFFIYLSLQKLKKGELLVFIINSLWLYNSEKYNRQKEKIFEFGDLIDAYRLPNNIFKGENRDTSIATDIVVFRKK